MFGGDLAVLQAPMFDGLSLDPFTLFDEGSYPVEVGVSRRYVVQALVVTLTFGNLTGCSIQASPIQNMTPRLKTMGPLARVTVF